MTSYDGILYNMLFVLGFECIILYNRSKHYEDAYWGERRGRARVEQEMRKIANVQLNTEKGFFVQPVGVIHSVYRQCVGTPRQGGLVPSSRATLVLNSNVSPEALDGLEEFSHVWITFKFHLNTNTLKESKAFDGVLDSKKRFTFTAKITPPMLKEKKGVLATRSPHRPNPVGVTLATIEGIDKKTRSILLSACDLVEGTPVLDVKPYVPAYDTVPNYRVPNWISETIDTRNTVIIKADAIEQANKIQNKFKHYKNEVILFLNGLKETLEVDVRSSFQTKRRQEDAQKGIHVQVPFDETIVKYFWLEDRKMEVQEIVLNPKAINPKIEETDDIIDTDSLDGNQE